MNATLQSKPRAGTPVVILAQNRQGARGVVINTTWSKDSARYSAVLIHETGDTLAVRWEDQIEKENAQ